VQLIIRLTAVRGALLDHLDENLILYEGVPAALDFVDRICQKIKGYILGEGSGPLQNILVLVRSCYLDTVLHRFRHSPIEARMKILVLVCSQLLPQYWFTSFETQHMWQ
jgi:hypothetical protein